MRESPQVVTARKHLGLAESDFRSGDGLAHLEKALALLEEIALYGTDERVRCARGLGTSAASRAMKSSGSKITCRLPPEVSSR